MINFFHKKDEIKYVFKHLRFVQKVTPMVTRDEYSLIMSGVVNGFNFACEIAIEPRTGLTPSHIEKLYECARQGYRDKLKRDEERKKRRS